MPGITKLTVNVPTESLERVRSYAAKRGLTMTEVVRRALGLLDFADKEDDKGGKILVERPGGEFRRIDI